MAAFLIPSIMKIKSKSGVITWLFLQMLLSCHNHMDAVKISADRHMLDSIEQHSDSTYIKPYYRNDFKDAYYYISKKDSTVTQVMKDKQAVIRQIIIQKNKKRIYAAQFFANGQLMYSYKFDNFGQYDGLSEEYYSTGIVRRKGIYKHGFRSGKWKNYDKDGSYTSADEYNDDGQQVRTIK